MTPKPRPIYRSLTFWAGALVLLSILWLWADSLRFASAGYGYAHGKSITFHMDAAHAIEIGFQPHGSNLTRSGRIQLGKVPNPVIPQSIHGGLFYRVPLPVSADIPVFRMPGFIASRQDVSLVLPFWLLVTLHGGLWGGLLFWRARRHRLSQAINDPAS